MINDLSKKTNEFFKKKKNAVELYGSKLKYSYLPFMFNK